MTIISKDSDEANLNNKLSNIGTIFLVLGIILLIFNGLEIKNNIYRNVGMIKILSSYDIHHYWDERYVDSNRLREGLLILREVDSLFSDERLGCIFGFGYFYLDNEDESLNFWDRCEDLSKRLIYHGKNAIDNNAYEVADDWFFWAARIEPNNWDSWFFRAEILLYLDDLLTAEDMYQVAVTKSYGNEIGRSDIYFSLGKLYQHHIKPRNLDLSWDMYTKALQYDNYRIKVNHSATYYKRGLIKLEMDQPEKAILECKTAIEMNPEYYWGHICLGDAYYDLDYLSKAIENYQDAIDINTNLKWAYRKLGDLYYSNGNYELSRSMYQKVLEVDPDFSYARDKLRLIDSDN